MAETMSVQRALSQLNLLDKRISDKISERDFVRVKHGDRDLRGYKNDEDYKKDVESRVESIQDLIKRRSAMKSAIVQSNATTQVEVAGTTYTVAEAIERKNSIEYDEQYLRTLKSDYAKALSEHEYAEDEFNKALDRQLETLNGKEGKTNIDANNDLLKAYREANEPKLVDPISIQKEIERVEKEIDEFTEEVDFKLAESNVVTQISF